jgi:1-acyl-sn-glycerol-3-phosphate acyltransferase
LVFIALLGVGGAVLVVGQMALSGTAAWRWRCFVFRQWARAMGALLGMKLQRSGDAESFTQTPTLIVANHLSYLDVIVLARQVDAVFVAKSEIAHWPLIGWLSRCLGTIFIERRRKRDILRVNGLIERALRNGQSVIVFPEGTTSAGDEMLPFKSSLLEPAIKLGVLVRCASLHYATAADEESAATAVCWWGEMDFVPHLWRLFQLQTFEAALHFGAQPIMATERKRLARELQATVAADYARLAVARTACPRRSRSPQRADKLSAPPLIEESLWLKQ